MEKRRFFKIFFCTALLAPCAPNAAAAQQVAIGSGSALEMVQRLRPGEFAWVPELAPEGPLLLIVNTRNQRATLYRNGIPIGVSTVSTGRAGYATPAGVFTILQKHVEHYSSKYDNAPMPYMQRLTWKGVALHAGQLPGYPASHGCIRLPLGFARLLYGETKLGMTVVVTDQVATPRVAPAEMALMTLPSTLTSTPNFRWLPNKSPFGPVSIIISIADGEATVLRNGVEIGAASVTVGAAMAGTWAYSLRNIDGEGQHWLRLPLSGEPANQPVPRDEWNRFQAPEGFRRAVAAIVQPGTTVIVTSDSLGSKQPATAVTMIENEPPTDDK